MTRTSFLPDSSCMVAMVSSWHHDHAATLAELDQRIARGEGFVVAGPALVEVYSVLTRLPAPHRLRPQDALALIEYSFLTDTRIATLDGRGYSNLLRTAPGDGIAGGATYDAVIAACARRARVRTLVTLNERHFARFAGPDLEVVVPAGRTVA